MWNVAGDSDEKEKDGEKKRSGSAGHTELTIHSRLWDLLRTLADIYAKKKRACFVFHEKR